MGQEFMEALLLTAVVVLGAFVIAKMTDGRAKRKRIEDEWHAIENEARWQANLRKDGSANCQPLRRPPGRP